jgi:DNA-binding transcriptional regulator YdaS (Cro superfamily)
MFGIAALRAAVRLLGSEYAVAGVVGCKQPTVNYTLHQAKRVPAEWCIPLEKATAIAGWKISRGAFRPDIYPEDYHAETFGGGVSVRHRESEAAIPAGAATP